MALITKNENGDIVKITPACCTTCGGKKNNSEILSKNMDNTDETVIEDNSDNLDTEDEVTDVD